MKTDILLSDEKLINEAKSGNNLAFKQLVIRYESQVRSTIYGMLGDVPEVSDIAQQVFINFFKSLNQFRGDAKLSTYLVKIAINLSLNELKKKKYRRFVALDNGAVPHFETSVSPTDQFEEKEILEKALAQMDKEQKAVIVLRLIDGYSVKETSEILQLPQGTVASRLARAQKKLLEFIKTLKGHD